MWTRLITPLIITLSWWVGICAQPSRPRAKSQSDMSGLSCGGQHNLHVGQPVHVTSLNFPKPYPRNQRCLYEFHCNAEDVVMSFLCSKFEIQRTRGCNKEFVRVYDASGSLAKTCGRQPPEASSAGGFLGVRFVTNRDKIRRSGFNCTVSCEHNTDVPAYRNDTITNRPSGTTIRTEVITITPNNPGASNESTSSIPVTSIYPDFTKTTVPSSTEIRTEATTSLPIPVPPYEPCYCGEANFFTRIVGGRDTEQHEYPWQVGLVKSDPIPFCGGSLLSSHFVLTAAHCVYNTPTDQYRLVFGEHDWQNSTDSILRDVDQVFIHPDYNQHSQDYDISLIRVNVAVNIFTFITSPVCLPTYTTDYTGKIAVATGWGATAEFGPLVRSTLQEVEVQVLEDSECSLLYPGRVTERMQCAGVPEGGKDSCQGDSGGPLVVMDNGLYVLSGITSWGLGCGRERKPGVYTKVQSLLPWIESTMGNEQGCSIGNEYQTFTSIQSTKVDITTISDINAIDSYTSTPKQEMLPITNLPTLPCKCGPLIQPSMLPAHSLQNHPWTLSLFSLGAQRKVFCSATIITTMNVLTAANCVNNRSLSSFRIRANEEIFGESVPRAITRKVVKVIINNDLALLELNVPINLTRYPALKPACLPQPNQEFLGLTNIHSGYDLGRVMATSGIWKTGDNPYRLTFSSKTEAFCGEDLGGPIVSRQGDHNYLAGIAIDSNCGNNQKSAKVSAYYSWIMTHHSGRFCSM